MGFWGFGVIYYLTQDIVSKFDKVKFLDLVDFAYNSQRDIIIDMTFHFKLEISI